jgi:hypothetical protein
MFLRLKHGGVVTTEVVSHPLAIRSLWEVQHLVDVLKELVLLLHAERLVQALEHLIES